MRDKPKAKRSKRRVWERTLWAIQKADGGLLGQEGGQVWLLGTRAAARTWCMGHEKPVKVRERIEVIE